MKCSTSAGRIVALVLFLCPMALVMLVGRAPRAVCELLLDNENELNLEENQEDQGRLTQQQGSWSHWWSYDGISGPDYWNINKRWRLCGSGQRQSPVEVRTERLIYDHLLGPFRLTWLGHDQSWSDQSEDVEQSQAKASRHKEANEEPQEEQPIKAQLLNSGRGLELWLEANEKRKLAKGSSSSDQLMLSGGPLSYHYKLYKLEFHSSPSSTLPATRRQAPASEHLIDGRSFDGELQLHFYNRHLASSAFEARRMAEGDAEHLAAPSASLYAIISVFLVLVGDRSGAELAPVGHQNTTPSYESAIDFMLNETLAEGGSSELTLTRSQVERLVPIRSQYITYQGSLNRPPCAELADWLLVNQALKVHVHKFRQLFEQRLAGYQENIRPVKPLNGRQLRTTIDLALSARHHTTSSGAKPLATLQRTSIECQATGDSHSSSSNNKDNNGNGKQPRLNCSQRQQEQDGGHQEPAIGVCSMRPHYVYQLNQPLAS